jgi:hypothetical protein
LPACKSSEDAALAPDGDVLTVGREFDYFAEVTPPFTVARYTPSGELDPGFAAGGVSTSRFFADYESSATQVVSVGDGYVVGGSVTSPACASRAPAGMPCQALAIAGFNADGSLNQSFGRDGLVARPWILPCGEPAPRACGASLAAAKR